MARNKEYIRKKIEAKKAVLSKYEEARLAIITGGQSYSIKNGDNTRTLTFADLSAITKLIEQTESEIEALQDKLDGCPGRAIVVGGTWR